MTEPTGEPRAHPRDAADPPILVLASASAGRLATLQRAGLHPVVEVSGAAEQRLDHEQPRDMALRLATLKARTVAERWSGPWALIVGCDSVLELDGVGLGKPLDAADATSRWRQMRGRSATLLTGHWVVRSDDDAQVGAVAATIVRFADVSDDDIAAYVASGEPLLVAGAFAVDGLAGPFIEAIVGDHHNVVGISLPLLRRLLCSLGVPWTTLWTPGDASR